MCHTQHNIYTPIFSVEFLFSTLCLQSSAEMYKFKTGRLGLCVTLKFPSTAFLVWITVLPVTTEVGGTSQVNVTTVPSWLGSKLESEIDGPGKRGIVREGEIKRGQESGGWGGGGERVYQDWRALFKGKEQPQVLLSSVWGPIVSFYSGEASSFKN